MRIDFKVPTEYLAFDPEEAASLVGLTPDIGVYGHGQIPATVVSAELVGAGVVVTLEVPDEAWPHIY